MLSKLAEEFEERNCKLLAIGVDSKIGHRNFIKDVQVWFECAARIVYTVYADSNRANTKTIFNNARRTLGERSVTKSG